MYDKIDNKSDIENQARGTSVPGERNKNNDADNESKNLKSHNEECHDFSLKEEDYFKPLKRLCMIKHFDDEAFSFASKNRPGIKSFSISDILAYTKPPLASSSEKKSSDTEPTSPSNLIRPWDTDEEDVLEGRCLSSRSSSWRPASSGPVLESKNSPSKRESGNPLDALFKMTNKTFDGSNNLSGTGE